VVSIVQHVDQIGVERVDVIELGELLEDRLNLIVERRLREFDFAHVEVANARNLVVGMDDRGRLPLSAGKHDVDKVLVRGHGLNLLEVIDNHFCGLIYRPLQASSQAIRREGTIKYLALSQYGANQNCQQMQMQNTQEGN
jgi:hypothetical protein